MNCVNKNVFIYKMSHTLRQKNIFKKCTTPETREEKGVQEINPRDRARSWRTGDFTSICESIDKIENNELPFGVDQNFIYGNKTALMNGFGGVPNSDTYIYGAPGSLTMPFQPNNFYCKYNFAFGGHPWLNRITQRQFNYDTKNLCISINNVAGRNLYLRRGQSYLFTFAGIECSPCLGSLVKNLDNLSTIMLSMYFTTDPIGGSEVNSINQTILENAIVNRGINPPRILNTAEMYPGSCNRVAIGTQFPNVLFYQSSLGPFLGGFIVCFGGCGAGWDDFPLDDTLPVE